MSSAVGVIGVSIPANQSLSGEIEIGPTTFIGVEIPASFGATVLTFQGKSNRENTESTAPVPEVWRDIYDDTGTEVSLTVASNRMVGVGTVVKLNALSAFRFIRVRTGTGAAPTNINPGAQLRIITKQP